MPVINSALSEKADVSDALVLRVNVEPKRVFSGQQTGHKGVHSEPRRSDEHDPAEIRTVKR